MLLAATEAMLAAAAGAAGWGAAPRLAVREWLEGSRSGAGEVWSEEGQGGDDWSLVIRRQIKRSAKKECTAVRIGQCDGTGRLFQEPEGQLGLSCRLVQTSCLACGAQDDRSGFVCVRLPAKSALLKANPKSKRLGSSPASSPNNLVAAAAREALPGIVPVCLLSEPAAIEGVWVLACYRTLAGHRQLSAAPVRTHGRRHSLRKCG